MNEAGFFDYYVRHGGRTLRLLAFLALVFVGCSHTRRVEITPRESVASVGRETLDAKVARQLDTLAESDPLSFLRLCLETYDRGVVDYRCRFIKQELLGGIVGREQEMSVLFRQEPFSVDVTWIRNPDLARRVTYVAGWWVEGGRELSRIHLNGLLGLVLPGGVKRDIHGREVKAAARRTIDQFGFRNTLELIIKYCEMAKGDRDYDLRYVSTGSIGGRPTYLFERRLPDGRATAGYPDRLLVINIDHQWLLPTACISYADLDRKSLLGRYITIGAEFNIGLTDAEFGAVGSHTSKR